MPLSKYIFVLIGNLCMISALLSGQIIRSHPFYAGLLYLSAVVVLSVRDGWKAKP